MEQFLEMWHVMEVLLLSRERQRHFRFQWCARWGNGPEWAFLSVTLLPQLVFP